MFLIVFMLVLILSPFLMILAPLIGGFLAFGIVIGRISRWLGFGEKRVELAK